jgi:uncharacterized alkaline shock family protein YloU
MLGESVVICASRHAFIESFTELPEPERIIRIEDVVSSRDIETAQRRRRIEGKHVIPASSVEIKQNYPKIFYEAIPILRRQRHLLPLPVGAEKSHVMTDVLPAYSRRQRINISDWALTQMVACCLAEHDSEVKVKKIVIEHNTPDEKSVGVRLAIEVDIPWKGNLNKQIAALQRMVIDDMEHFTGISIEEVNIIIDKQTIS